MRKQIRLAVLVSLGCLGVACGGSVGSTDGTATDGVPIDDPTAPVVEVTTTAFGEPLAGLTAEERARFDAGKEEFLAAEEADEGLGPVFNDTACAACHSAPAVGGSSAVLETRFGARNRGRFDPLANLGGSLIQVKGLGDVGGGCFFPGETVPAQANRQAGRRSVALFGLGLVDAVPERTLRNLAASQRRNPAEAGRVALVHDIARNQDVPGRFGWKDQVPTLHQFAGDAYLNEMGITTPEFPNENCPQGDCALLARCNPLPTLNDAGDGVVAFQDFMTLLGPPPRGSITGAVSRGERVFRALACNRCHTESLNTGNSPVAALRWKTFHPYSDFLLHDMGSLGDGIELGGARGGEFRTSPLWGLRQQSVFLHDGRASTVAGAIQAHDGQGRRARDAFNRLGTRDRSDLLEFLGSL